MAVPPFPESRDDYLDSSDAARTPGEATDAGDDLIDILVGLGVAANNVESTVETAVTEQIAAHVAGESDPHSADSIVNVPAGTVAATDVQGAIDELASDKAEFSQLTDHTDETAGAHAASAISVTPAGTIAGDTVQEALEELDSEKTTAAAAAALIAAVTLNDLADVNTSGVATNSVIKYNGSGWVVGTDNDSGAGTGATQLDELTDVDLTGQDNGDGLVRVAGVWTPVDVATQAELDAHTADATDAHDASAISFAATGGIAATDVQTAVAEVDSEAAKKASNLSDLASASTARTNLELGTIATQDSDDVTITGGAISGVTITSLASDLNISEGGTGAGTAAAALTNLGAASSASLTSHTAAASAAHAASAVSVNPAGFGNSSATNVQSVLSAFDAAITSAEGGTSTDYTGVYNVKHPTYGALGDGINDDTAEIQAAIDACSAAGGGVVFLPEGIYQISFATRANTFRAGLILYSDVTLAGAGRECTQLRLMTNQISGSNKNYIVMNANPNASSNFDHNMHVTGLTINGNAANQAGTIACNGIGFLRAQHVTCSWVDVYDQKGTDTSSNESFGFDVLRGSHARFLYCRAYVVSTVNCSSGFSANYSTDISYVGCDSYSHTTVDGGGIGFAMYNTVGVNYTDCRAWSNESTGFNSELSDCVYVNCQSGITTSDLVNGSGGPYSINQDLGNGGNGFTTNGDIESISHSGPRCRGVYIGCRSSNNNVGFSIKLGRGFTAAAGTTGSTIVSSAAAFYPNDAGSYIRVGNGPYVRVATYVSTTSVTTDVAHGGVNGNTGTIVQGQADIIGCQIDRNGTGINSASSGTGTGDMADKHFLRVSGCRFTGNGDNMEGFGPGSSTHTPFGYIRADGGGDTVQPAVPATGVLLYNPYAHDCRVYIFASAITWSANGIQKRGQGVAHATSTLTTDTLVPGASCTGVIPVHVAAGEAIALNYTAKNGTDTLNWRWEAAMTG
jgi:hypothetical protein